MVLKNVTDVPDDFGVESLPPEPLPPEGDEVIVARVRELMRDNDLWTPLDP